MFLLCTVALWDSAECRVRYKLNELLLLGFLRQVQCRKELRHNHRDSAGMLKTKIQG